MRLLHASTYQLHSFEEHFPIADAGRYAILSHTWGKSEMTFGLMQKLHRNANGNADDVFGDYSGFQKIRLACRQALADGLEYVWIDTCCIDKSSSSELSEAINSMFRCYQNASVCYAYLDDVDANQSSQAAHDPLSLLLPPEAYSLGGVTTRTEDIAYCLLGIFGVNMTMLYGEGGKAFVRLQEEILKDSTDQSLFAWEQSPLNTDSSHLQEIRPTDKGRPIFAKQPLDFGWSSFIQATLKPGKSYTLTNKGVDIELPILPIQHAFLPGQPPLTWLRLGSLRLAILECTFGDNKDALVGVVIQEVDHHANQFARHETAGLVRVTKDQYLKATLSRIYLCKTVPGSRQLRNVESRLWPRPKKLIVGSKL